MTFVASKAGGLLVYAAAWRERLERALLKIENRRRREEQDLGPLPADTPVIFLQTDEVLVRLRVWCERLCVSPEFVLDKIITYWRVFKHVPSSGPVLENGRLYLRISSQRLGGAQARDMLKAAVLAAFPNGENRHVSDADVMREFPPVPFDLEDPDAWLAKYRANIEAIRRRLERRRHEEQEARGRRTRQPSS